MDYSFIDLTGNGLTPEQVKTSYEVNPDTNAFTDALKSAVEQNKVKDVSSSSQNNTLTFTYMDDTTTIIDLTTLVTDVYVAGASLDATSNVLTLSNEDGGSDVTVDLSDFVNSAELENALDTKVDILSWSYLSSNWSVEPSFNSNNGDGDIYNYTLNGVTRYRFVPTVYNPTEDAFYEEVGLTTLITKRG